MKLHRTASKALQAFLCGSAVFAFSAFGSTAKSSEVYSHHDVGTVTAKAHDAAFGNSGPTRNDIQVADRRGHDDWDRNSNHGRYDGRYERSRGHYETQRVLVRPGYYENYQVWVPGYFDYECGRRILGHYEMQARWIPARYEYRQVWVRY